MSPRSTQLRLPLKGKPTHGGRRTGAGRPNLSGKQAHLRRPRLNPRHPLHVTLRLSEDLRGLRRKELFHCFRIAVRKARGKGLKLVHFALLSNHLHLLLEPAEESAKTGRALQSLTISFAKLVNTRLSRRGPVFGDRYHQHVLETPTETRRALDYVLTNEGRHRGTDEVAIDPYSSAYAFREWHELLGGRKRVRFRFTAWNEDAIEAWLGEILSKPRTWLLRAGWQRGRAS